MTVKTPPEWSIQQIARLAGTTSRTLRHYDDLGLVPPSRVGHNGYRYYDARALVRLQRVLLLRELGLGLPQIGEVLAGRTDDLAALEHQLQALRAEQGRLARQIASVETTITTLRGGENPMAEEMFDGFDHTQYREEVEERWGARPYAESDAWWRGMSRDEQGAWKERVARLASDWSAAAERGVDPDSDEAVALASRHVEWLRGIPGTPARNPATLKAYVLGLADMYVADARFAANYGGESGATFVRDSLRAYAAKAL
ncbi:MAG: TipAS antibiotic-recognition domain-containing protein [Actinomycetales bacterium]|nr:TipAS antibiotic-recognition domain-containing protein [Actinomycetales bacterium]